MSEPEPNPNGTEHEIQRLRRRIAELDDRPGHTAAVLEALLRALPGVVMRFDSDLRIDFVSRIFPGMNEAQVLGTDALSFIPKEDHARARATIQRVLRTGEPDGYFTTGPGPHGEERRYQVFVSPCDTDETAGGCFVALDVTEALEGERALAESERRLRIALASTKLGVWSWNLVTGELLWDEGMKQAMGRTEGLTLSEYVELAVHPDDRESVRAHGRRSMESGHFEPLTHRIVRPDGEVRWMLSVGEVEKDEQGRPVHVMGGNLDITEQRSLEEQLRRAQKLESVGLLTSGVAHNFNNMLMTVMPSLELLRTVVPSTHVDLLDEALAASERAADMIRKLMTFTGQRPLGAASSCDVGALTARLVAMCERTFDRHIRLSYERSHTNLFVMAAASDLEQVLLNLLLNARDAVLDSRREAPRIDVHVRSVREDPRLPGVHPLVVVQVRDEGIGMSGHVKQHAFDPFFTSKEVGRGTGLGLATTYAIVRDLGGCIELDSVEGVGTTATLVLPAADESPAHAAPVPTPTKAEGRVLIVDDEPAIRRVVSQILEEQGFLVASASDGPTAFAELARHAYDVILLDRSMPGAPGKALLGELRRLAPNAKIAYFTGQNVPGVERDEVDAVLAKPARVDELLEVVAELVTRTR